MVSQDNFGFDLAAVEAAAKKHEAIETDIFAYEERVQAVISVASELETEKYHDIDRINARRDNVLRLWNYLIELLKGRRSRLELSLQLQHTFQVSDTCYERLIIWLKLEDYDKLFAIPITAYWLKSDDFVIGFDEFLFLVESSSIFDANDYKFMSRYM